MAAQASRMNRDRWAESEQRVGPIQGVTHGASSVINDGLDLLELQSELLRADTSKCLRRAKAAIVGVLVAISMMLASLPVLALGLSSLLQWSLQWPLWVCQTLVGGLFVAAGIGLGWWAVQRMRSSLAAFSDSRREAKENMRWLRQALSRSLAG